MMTLHSITLALGAAALLAGCSASATRTSGTSTSQATYHLDCSGSFLSMQSCIEKANSICPQGYDVIDKRVREMKVRASQSRQDGVVLGKEQKEMDIRCRRL